MLVLRSGLIVLYNELTSCVYQMWAWDAVGGRSVAMFHAWGFLTECRFFKMLKYQFQSVNTGQTWSNYVLWCPYQLLEPLNQSRRSHWWCLVSQRWVQKSDFQSTLRSVPERFLVEFSGQITCKSSPWVSPTCWRCRRPVSSGVWVTFRWIYFLGSIRVKISPLECLKW